MRTIFDIELIKTIWENPISTIGQRSNKCFECFYSPFDMFREIKNIDFLQKNLTNIPSIQEVIENEFSCKLGSRNWKAPLRYLSEDERELFKISIDYIFKYDNKYPIPNGLEIDFKIKNNLNLNKYLGQIGYRPEMYLNSYELSCLRAFIDGYYFLKEQYNLKLTDFEIKLAEFINQYKVKDNDEFKTWDRNYRWKWDLAVYGTNESRSIPHFLADIEEFTETKLIPVLNNTEKQIDWKNYNKKWTE